MTTVAFLNEFRRQVEKLLHGFRRATSSEGGFGIERNGRVPSIKILSTLPPPPPPRFSKFRQKRRAPARSFNIGFSRDGFENRRDKTTRPGCRCTWTVYDGGRSPRVVGTWLLALPCSSPSPSVVRWDSRKRQILSVFCEFDCRVPPPSPRHRPPLSISFGSRVIDTLSTVSRLRCRGWPTYRVDSRRTINSIHYHGVERGGNYGITRRSRFRETFRRRTMFAVTTVIMPPFHKRRSRVLLPCSTVSRNHTRGTKRGVSLGTLYTSPGRTCSHSPSSDSHSSLIFGLSTVRTP